MIILEGTLSFNMFTVKTNPVPVKVIFKMYQFNKSTVLEGIESSIAFAN